MKHLFFSLGSTVLMTCLLASPVQAVVMTCTNCSTEWTAAMDQITNLEELKNTVLQYEEAIRQTLNQAQMIANQLNQYKTMVQNTINLPQNIINQTKGRLKELAQLTKSLKLQKGDYMAMGQVFDKIYPGLDIIKGLAGGDASKSISEVWNEWSAEVDRAAQATFQVSGQQLDDLANDSEALDNHIDSLLTTPEGQMQAIQSGNSLAAIQIDEMRKMRMLMATNIQMTTQMAMKEEKRGQLSKEQIDHILDTSEMASQYKGYE